jgi:hypothetical protein
VKQYRQAQEMLSYQPNIMSMKNTIGAVTLTSGNPSATRHGADRSRLSKIIRLARGSGLTLVWLAWMGLFVGVNLSQAYTTNKVEKVANLSFSVDPVDGFIQGGYAPLDRFTQVGTNLWFTTSLGGYYGVGTVSRFDLTSHEVVQVASLDNQNTGAKPESPLTVIGDEAYFTTINGGISNRGVIAKINLTDGTLTPVFTFQTNGLNASKYSIAGASPRAGVTQIGDDLWTLTQSGGSSNRGVVLKYNLTSGTPTVVTNLDGPVLGGQPMDGFTRVGNAWYFVTFVGGATFNKTNYPTSILPDGSTITITNKTSIGAGTLGRLTFDASGNPVVSTVANVPGGFEQGPGVAPIGVGTNSIYFTSSGPNSLPGAILRYDIDTGLLTNLFSFSTNPIPAAQYGTRPGYSGLTEWQGELYFINRNGGTNSGGTLAKFNIASNTVIKLADLGSTNLVDDLGSPSGFFGAGTIVQEANRFYVYYPLTSGGANNVGSIIRVALPPLSIQQTGIVFTNSGTNLVLSWSGGYPPFDVLTNSDLSVSSTNWASTVTNITSDVNATNWSVTLPTGGTSLFYRIRGQSQ